MRQQFLGDSIAEEEVVGVIQRTGSYENAVKGHSELGGLYVGHLEVNSAASIELAGTPYASFRYVDATDPHSVLRQQVGKKPLPAPHVEDG